MLAEQIRYRLLGQLDRWLLPRIRRSTRSHRRNAGSQSSEGIDTSGYTAGRWLRRAGLHVLGNRGRKLHEAGTELGQHRGELLGLVGREVALGLLLEDAKKVDGETAARQVNDHATLLIAVGTEAHEGLGREHPGKCLEVGGGELLALGSAASAGLAIVFPLCFALGKAFLLGLGLCLPVAVDVKLRGCATRIRWIG